MIQLNLPPAAAAYFAAKESQDQQELAMIFTEDAVAWDNGEDLELRGLGQIQARMADTSGKYKLTTELKSAENRGDELVVAVVVSGGFPGSPYEFAYRFEFAEEKIKSLAIDPIGPVNPTA